MRIHLGMAFSTAVVGYLALAPAPARALELPVKPWGPVVVGPVTLDPQVSVDPNGVDVDADASVELPNVPRIDLGASGGVDEGGINGGLRLPSAPPVQVPQLPEPVAGVVDDLLPAPESPGSGGVPPAGGGAPSGAGPGVPNEAVPGALDPPVGPAPIATSNERTLDGEAAVSGAMVEPRGGIWSTIGQVAARFGPWFALIALALVVQLVARSALRERLRPRPS